MIRIGEGVYPDDISERNFFTPRGQYAVDQSASQTMKDSLMYKMSYYRFADLYQGGQAVDRVRNVNIPATPIKLSTLDDAYSTEVIADL
jgi:dolichyl-diphosphooligosaccharide--protein glycosyltransferase